MGILDQFKSKRAPATMVIVGLSVIVFVVSWMMQGRFYESLLFFTDFSKPWGLLTYPFASAGDGQGLIWVIFELLWMFWIGTSVETELGTSKFLMTWLVFSILACLLVSVGIVLVYGSSAAVPVIGGLGLPLSALTVIWGVRNRAAIIRLYMVLPVPGIVLAWVTVALTLFGFGSIYHAPLIGGFAVLHLAAAWYFALDRIPFAPYRGAAVPSEARSKKKVEMMSKEYYDDVARREKERADRERLRKMFEDNSTD